MNEPTIAADSRCILFGLPMDPLSMDQVLLRCEQALETRVPITIGVVNAAKVINLGRDQLLRDSMLECDLILADGQAVVWASRLLGRPLPERVAGIDLFEQLLRNADENQRSVYFLGARPEVLTLMLEQISERFPRLRVAGSRDGYFDQADSAQVAKEIAESRADMLFLGMTSPKKEIFLGEFGALLTVPVQHGVGGSFDIMAGITKRAPQRWQRSGFEWLFRLLQEPRRMWRRYLRTNSAFIVLTIRERIHRRPLYVRSAGR